MASKVQDLYDKAMRLSEDEREVLLLLLTNAMQGGEENNGWASPEIERAWMEEIERREQLAAEGKMEWLPVDEAFRCLREQLHK